MSYILMNGPFTDAQVIKNSKPFSNSPTNPTLLPASCLQFSQIHLNDRLSIGEFHHIVHNRFYYVSL